MEAGNLGRIWSWNLGYFLNLPPKKEVIISFNIKVCLCNQWVVAFSFPWMFVSKLQDDGSGMRAKTKGKAKRRSWSLSMCLRVLLSGGLFL